jgi:hypothetical protein
MFAKPIDIETDLFGKFDLCDDVAESFAMIDGVTRHRVPVCLGKAGETELQISHLTSSPAHPARQSTYSTNHVFRIAAAPSTRSR